MASATLRRLLLMVALGYLVYLGAILLGLLRLESARSRKIVLVAMLCYFWVLIGLNTNTPDYVQYEFLYRSLSGFTSYEPGYTLLNNVCYLIGLSFSQFRMVVASAVVIFTGAAVHRYARSFGRDPRMALSLYLLFPFVGYASGLRQAVSTAIVCYALSRFMLDEQRGRLHFAIWIGIATMFHYDALFYIILLLAGDRKVQRSLILVTLAAIALFLGLLLSSGLAYDIASSMGFSDKVASWFDWARYDHPSLYSFLSMVVLQCALLALVEYSCSILARASIRSDKVGPLLGGERFRFRMVNIAYLMLVALPFCAINFTFFRFVKGVLLLYFIVFSCAYTVGMGKEQGRLDRVEKRTLFFVFVLVVAWCLVMSFVAFPPSITTTAIEYNALVTGAGSWA